MKVYLDNNVVSAIAFNDSPLEADAIARLLKASDEGKVKLVTSEITLCEIQQYRGQTRPALEDVFQGLGRVPIARWDDLVGINVQIDMYTCINSPIIRSDPIYDALRAAGVKSVDAQHVFVAAKQACISFLTCDGGILHRAQTIRTRCGIDVQKPSAFVSAQGW
jgi:hypothetical protein